MWLFSAVVLQLLPIRWFELLLGEIRGGVAVMSLQSAIESCFSHCVVHRWSQLTVPGHLVYAYGSVVLLATAVGCMLEYLSASWAPYLG
jgi:hypothetical protein